MVNTATVSVDELRAYVASLPQSESEPRGVKATVLAIAPDLIRLKNEKRYSYPKIAAALEAKGIKISEAGVRQYLTEYAEANGLQLSGRRRKARGAHHRKPQAKPDKKRQTQPRPNPRDQTNPLQKTPVDAPTHAGFDEEA